MCVAEDMCQPMTKKEGPTERLLNSAGDLNDLATEVRGIVIGVVEKLVGPELKKESSDEPEATPRALIDSVLGIHETTRHNLHRIREEIRRL